MYIVSVHVPYLTIHCSFNAINHLQSVERAAEARMATLYNRTYMD